MRQPQRPLNPCTASLIWWVRGGRGKGGVEVGRRGGRGEGRGGREWGGGGGIGDGGE